MKPEDIPETVKWLLDFANLGCIPGEPNPQRFKSVKELMGHKDFKMIF